MNDQEFGAFVAGATGYTGREVVEAYARRGQRVWAHIRPDSGRLDEWTSTFEGMGAHVDTTRWELEAMTATFERLRPSLVYALLGTTKKRATGEGMGAREAYEKIDYGLTALLIEAARRSGHAPRFVYLSAAGLNENTRNPYMRARVRAEADLRASGLPFVIVRPSFITGPDRPEHRPSERFYARIVDGTLDGLARLGARGLRNRYHSMTARELAQGMVRALDDTDDPAAVLHYEELR